MEQVKRINSIIEIDDGEFQYKTNFAGRPDNAHTKGGVRYFNIVLKDYTAEAEELEDLSAELKKLKANAGSINDVQDKIDDIKDRMYELNSGITQRYGSQPLSIKKLIDDRWNVKFTKPNNEYEEPVPYLEVCLKFEPYPPMIYEITSRNKVRLEEDMVKTLDEDKLERVDLDIRPYNWTVNEKHGVKAYLKTMYATIKEDRFTVRYGSVSNGD